MPQDVLSDGFVGLCIDTSLNFYDGKCRLLVEGQYLPNVAGIPVVADVPIVITSTRYIDAMFTAGSALAQALKIMFETCPANVEISALPRADLLAGVKAEYELTITGPATSDGTMTLFLGNKKYSIAAAVTSGDSVATIAAALAAEIPADFPYVVTAIATGLKFVAKNKGTVGNYLNPVYNWAGFQNYAPTGVTVSLERTVDGTGDPTPLDYATALGTCCYSVYALLGSSAVWQRGMRDWVRKAWSCDEPQCFGHAFTYDVGTLGQVLAKGDNSAEFNRLAYKLDGDGLALDVNFPFELVAAQAALRACSACQNPELSIQGPSRGVLTAIFRPESCLLPWSITEQKQLKDGGFNVYGPVSGGQGAYTNPYIYNDVTNYLYDELNRPNVTFRDTNSRYLAAKTALAIATELQKYNGLGLFTKNTRVLPRVFGTNPRMIEGGLKTWAKSQVGGLFSEFEDMEQDIQLFTDFEVAPSCFGIPGKLHAKMRYRPPVRISNVAFTLQPKVLDNCQR